MKILIVEDENRAARRLEQIVRLVLEKASVIVEFYEPIDSVATAISFLQTAPELDLVFLDIQLADGLSFEIFDSVHLPVPVIFTTAFDEYAIRAFQLHSIDYLLKPIDDVQLGRALDKFFALKTVFGAPPKGLPVVQGLETGKLSALLQTLSSTHQTYKSRFLVPTAHGFTSVPTEDIAYFFSEHKVSWLVGSDGKKYALDCTMEQLVSMLNPRDFFRVNRQCITSFHAIQHIVSSFHGKLKLTLLPPAQEDIIVGREKAPMFKEWLDR